MTIAYEAGFEGSFLVATLAGALGPPDVAGLRLNLFKSLAEQPAALLLDLSALHVAEPLSLAVLTVATRQAASWPGAPMLLCAPPPATREHLAAPAYRELSVFDTLDAGRAHLAGDAGAALPDLSDQLLPVAGAARHARDVATDACLRWDLPHLAGPASLIANELVSNVVDHAHTMMTLRLSLQTHHLTVAVRDGSPVEVQPPAPAPPEERTAHGLVLVDAIAHAWGCLPSADGKVVWASLRR